MNNGLSRTELENYFHIFSQAAEIKCRFRPGVYNKYNVKRGLRNEDGPACWWGLPRSVMSMPMLLMKMRRFLWKEGSPIAA